MTAPRAAGMARLYSANHKQAKRRHASLIGKSLVTPGFTRSSSGSQSAAGEVTWSIGYGRTYRQTHWRAGRGTEAMGGGESAAWLEASRFAIAGDCYKIPAH